MKRKLRDTWEAGATAVNAWLSIPSPVTAELAGRQAFDSITIDLQHGLSDYSVALGMLQALAASEATPMARVPWLEPGIIMKLLDAGALGLICPMVNSRAEAETFVRYASYAPRGTRSFGPTRAVVVYGADYQKRANDEIVLFAMVETAEALAKLDEIVTTPGLTGIYIGPSDLALSLGCTAKLDHDDPKVLAAIERILAAAHGAGLKAGMHCVAPAYARRMIDLGFDLVTVGGSDVRVYGSALAQVIADTRD